MFTDRKIQHCQDAGSSHLDLEIQGNHSQKDPEVYVDTKDTGEPTQY